MANVYTPDNLIAGETQIVTGHVIVASGETFERGAVLGRVAADGKYKLCDNNVSDGSEVANAIATESVDASGGDVADVAVYIKGEFNARALTFGGSHTAETVKGDFRKVGIYVKDTVAR